MEWCVLWGRAQMRVQNAWELKGLIKNESWSLAYLTQLKSKRSLTLLQTCSRSNVFFPFETRYLAVELPSTPAPTTHTSNNSAIIILPCLIKQSQDPLEWSEDWKRVDDPWRHQIPNPSPSHLFIQHGGHLNSGHLQWNVIRISSQNELPDITY